ncbi:type II secretion system protein N [Luteimonas sp. RD2P54]|uniref:Type II secretion system protein N n=1 Tax=Luteimonas endophytica TaxID=3042023 RepID=A0ABT6JBD4_9GAMM|nr:type II secretion system protein N [Luteimonas endophytica]MDH5824147.1 type II secretion system protein N [Luteimonas endophytica]
MSKFLSNLRLHAGGGRPATGRAAVLRTALEIALVLLLAAQAARLVWILATPLGPIGTASAAPTPAAGAALSLSSDPFFPSARSGAAQASAHGYRLFGVRRGDHGGSAILAGSDGAQGAYEIGDEIADGVVLQAVGADHAVLRAGGGDHRIALQAPAAGGAAIPAPARPSLPAARPDAGTEAASIDAAQLLAQAGLRARTEAGRVTGYTLIPRGGGALLRQAGLQAGDVLLAVNGQALTPERLTELEQELSGRDRAELTVQRGGETTTITLRTTSP